MNGQKKEVRNFCASDFFYESICGRSAKEKVAKQAHTKSIRCAVNRN